jgi:hypothetical protein
MFSSNLFPRANISFKVSAINYYSFAEKAKLQIALQLWSGLAAGSYSFLGFSTNALYHIAVKKSTLAFS